MTAHSAGMRVDRGEKLTSWHIYPKGGTGNLKWANHHVSTAWKKTLDLQLTLGDEREDTDTNCRTLVGGVKDGRLSAWPSTSLFLFMSFEKLEEKKYHRHS
jgi:hypothetical protein